MGIFLKTFFLGMFLCFCSLFSVAMAERLDEGIAFKAWKVISSVERENGIPSGLLHSMSLVETGKGVNGKILPWPYTVRLNSSLKKESTDSLLALNNLIDLMKLGYSSFNIYTPQGVKKRLSYDGVKSVVGSSSHGDRLVIEGRPFSKRFPNKMSAVLFAERMLNEGVRNMDLGLMQINWYYHGDKFSSVADAFDPSLNARYAVRYLRQHRESRDWWGSVGRYHSGTKVYAEKYIRSVYSMYRKIHRMDKAA